MSLLDVKDLKTYFYTDSGVAKAVDGVTSVSYTHLFADEKRGQNCDCNRCGYQSI